MKEFDSGLPDRKFDNLRFVNLSDFSFNVCLTLLSSELCSPGTQLDATFAAAALAEVPEQVDAMKKLGFL